MSAHSRSSLWTLLFTALLALVAVLGACSERPSPRFPHAVHLARIRCGGAGQPSCLDCTSCHARWKHEALADAENLCASCHKQDQQAALAVLSAPKQRPFGEILFDHEQHLAMPEIRGQCVSCHAGVVDTARPRLPPMQRCFACHTHEREWQRGECTPCHARRDLTRTLPQSFLRHDAGFVRRHGQLATEQKQLCASCHARADCDGCHDVSRGLAVERRYPERIERNFVHVGDFLSRHALEAETEPARCVRCHSPQSCDACHLKRGVSANAIGARNPHPVGWVRSTSNVRSPHGEEARRDILACAGCHDQGPATNCIRCHRVGGYGGNPHPGGWNSARGQDARMCRYCHG